MHPYPWLVPSLPELVRDHTDLGPDDVGWLGPRYAAPADPGTITFVPRPDWYFYFLFYLLRIFKWPESVVIGTVGIPTVLMILLFALPLCRHRLRPTGRLRRV